MFTILAVKLIIDLLVDHRAEVAAEHEAGIQSFQMKEGVKKNRIKVQHGRLNGREIDISGESVFLSNKFRSRSSA